MAKKTSVLEELRGRLLDLSLRNNLLNYHALSARSIEIVDGHVGEVYSLLVLKEKAMKFYPTGKGTATPEEKNLWKYPIFSVNPKHADQNLNTPYSEVDLRKRLYTLQTKSRTVFEEQGYPILYLALGIIEGNDTAMKGLKAPLLLIPVNLEKQKVKENYSLTWSGEDPIISPSLAAKFAESGIILPEFDHPETLEDVQKYFEVVASIIQPKKWKLLPGIVLDLFSFKKYVMYKDLDDASWGEGFAIEDSPLVRSIFAPTASSSGPDTGISLKSSDFCNIMDADSSQLAVIAEAKTGKNLVVEGPPGTGKSQTIANMIAEMLAAGKSVLFVSEKMAALQVVKRRLDAAGLSRFLLELHSQNAKKIDFLRELESCLQQPVETGVTVSPREDILAKIISLSDELSGYCKELQQPVGACGFTPYDLFGIREQYRYDFEEMKGGFLPSVPLKNASKISPEEYRAAVAALTNIESYMPTLLRDGETIATHPWAASNPGRILPGDRDEIRTLAVTFRDSIRRINIIAEEIADAAGLPFIPKNGDGLPVFFETYRVIGQDLPLTEGILEDPTWQNRSTVDTMVTDYRKIYTLRKTVADTFTPDIAAKDAVQLYQEFLKISEKSAFSRKFSSEYKNLRAEIRSCLRDPKASDDAILNGLKDAKIYVAEHDAWREREAACAALFAPVWTGDSTDPAVIESYASWIRTLLSWEREGRITRNSIRGIIAGKTWDAETMIAEMETRYADAQTVRRQLMDRIGMEDTSSPRDFAEMEKMASGWVENIDRLESWTRFLSYISQAKETAAAGTANLAQKGKLPPDAIIPSFVTGYVDSLLKETHQIRPRLAQFAQIPHEQKIETFKELDRMVLKENAATIVQDLTRRMPTLFDGASRESEMGILSGEFNRKRGHMAIRTLMTKAGGLIQKIKPCFMMSPLSIAQYLDPRSVTFDIIIFDEASQVKPEDALGALMRGRQLVVMGDSRQLPPTTFFDSVGGNDEANEDGTAEITDMESLLHACKQVYPTRRLTWHYRSRHESLITVSNAEFYDGSLFVFPSPKHDTTDLGLSFVHTEGTIYERGRSGVNHGEAKQIASAVIEYYQRFPDKTLGVVTFSVKQQDSIRHEVDLLLRDHPGVEASMHTTNGEDFFVKNLETVQGDERDTILISIGYGYDEEHKLSRNFGPLSQAGGERRLNVLITRARERCVVYANFRGYDLTLGPETPRGVTALAAFLIYAETRNTTTLGENAEVKTAPDSFADTVAKMLEMKGYAVMRNLGCARFMIDIAVVDPQRAGVFMAGILCDGPNYWSAEDARDRDRLRSQILEGLGWTLIRIWAPEWFCSPHECERRLLEELEYAENPALRPQPKTKSVRHTAAAPGPAPLRRTAVPAPATVAAAATAAATKIPGEPMTEEHLTPQPKPQGKQPANEKIDNLWEALPAERPMNSIDVGFRSYTAATGGILTKFHQFSSMHDSDIATAIVEIARGEGPISLNTLYSRIKELGRVPRMTPAIKDNIVRLIGELVKDGQLNRDGEGFVEIPGSRQFPRTRGPKWDIADVSLNELLLAAYMILKRQRAIPKSDLAKLTGSLLGFKVTAGVRDRCERAIDMGIRFGMIVEENRLCVVKS